MKRQSGHTFRLDRTGEQAAKMTQFADCVRYVYNRMLAIQRDQYEKTGKQDRYHALSKLLPVWKHDSVSGWLSDAPSQALQCAGRNLDTAWDRFFDPAFFFFTNHKSQRFTKSERIAASAIRRVSSSTKSTSACSSPKSVGSITAKACTCTANCAASRCDAKTATGLCRCRCEAT